MGSQFAYSPEGTSIVSYNGTRNYNKPLYGDRMPAVVLTGDLPMIRFVHEPHLFGTFLIAYVREGAAVWLQQFTERKTIFRPNRTQWELSSVQFPELAVTCEVVPLAAASGFSIQLKASGTEDGDELIWLAGGGSTPQEYSTLWLVDPSQHPGTTTTIGFDPADCLHNSIRIDSQDIVMIPPHQERHALAPQQVRGVCSEDSVLRIADAQAWRDALEFAASAGDKYPALCGRTGIKDNAAIYWAFQREQVNADSGMPLDPMQLFQDGYARAMKSQNRVRFDTPDPYMNAALPMLSASIDATYYPPVYVHGAMSWNRPYPGWRSLYGPIRYGWHQEVGKQMEYYLASQILLDEEKQAAAADPEFGYALQAPHSRFYGSGRIVQDQLMYNMQEVLFDQFISAWRARPDFEGEEKLRTALELHLQWMKDCFDPDGDGVYESYINVWASDTIWYSGGGTAQSSAYAYNGHRAAMEMAERVNDEPGMRKHLDKMKKIREGVIQSLWIRDKGYMAEYREALGHRRRHDQASLYTVFLPIDAGLVSWEESVQMLHYSEWGLERSALPGGGELCWTSNFVPWVWSVRELDYADNFHLALAYYQSGLSEAGWKLLRGAYIESTFGSVVPGSLVCIPVWMSRAQDRATDFTDTVSTFARLVLEGLYGYMPNYPQGSVHFQPQFPDEWDQASVAAPDFTLNFKRSDAADRYSFTLTVPAKISVKLPVSARSITQVLCNGAAVSWTTLAGPGKSYVTLEVSDMTSAIDIQIFRTDRMPIRESLQVTTETGSSLRIRNSGQKQFSSIRDPQQVLSTANVNSEGILGVVTSDSSYAGNHLLLGKVRVGDLEQWLLVKLLVTSPRPAFPVTNLIPMTQSTQWSFVNMETYLNADVRDIYKQKYISPRPQTCSVQLGDDGYSPWTYYYWKKSPPDIDLANVQSWLDSEGTLRTKQGIPFRWNSGQRNIAFTSLWDNWPTSLEFAVNRSGKFAAFLVCGSTNVMQTGIANAVIRILYASGCKESVELVHPTNYWSLSEDYDDKIDKFALPADPPATLQLGNYCRAMIITVPLRPEDGIQSFVLETLSPEVVVGLMAASIVD